MTKSTHGEHDGDGEPNDWLSNQSRRELMRKGVLASGALGLGLAGTGGAAARSEPRSQQSQQEVLVFLYGYQANLPFRVSGVLQTSNVVTLLTTFQGERVPEITQPDNYNGYIISLFGLGTFIPTFLFTRQPLNVGNIYRFTTDFQTYSTKLGLVSVPIVRSRIPAGGQGGVSN